MSVTAGSKIGGLTVIPSGLKPLTVGSKTFLQMIKRSRKKFKLSKAQRAKISTAAKRFKIPVVTALVVAPAVLDASTRAQARAPLFSQEGFRQFSRFMLENYTGFDPLAKTFNATNALTGLGPLILLMVVKRAGLLKSFQRPVSQLSGGLLSAT